MRVEDANFTVFAALVVVIISVLVAGSYLSQKPITTTQTQTLSSTITQVIDGVVAGYVTAGPARPTCSPGESCTENMTGYSVIFTPKCQVQSASCVSKAATLNPAGHYSILLPPGSYIVSGLSPSCPWVGCSSAFPKEIGVQAGMQLVFNIDIDTGIR